jgi:polyisoprenyl-phosphate glycosyltransferase
MLSIIIPVYKNEESIPSLINTLSDLHTTITKQIQIEVNIVFVVDGSPDMSSQLLRENLLSPDICFNSILVELSRNFGSFQAIRAGLEEIESDYYIVMAADLQEPPSLSVEMATTLSTNEYDLVVGSRESRQDGLFSTFSSNIFWTLYRQLVFHSCPAGGLDVFGCNKLFRDQLITLNESNSSLIGQLLWLGFRRKELLYNRQERQHGKSAWTLTKKVKYFMDSLFSFTDLPIIILLSIGFISLFVSFVLILLIITAKLTGSISVPGYTATMSIFCFFAGLNSLGLGVIGIYAWRAYENTKNRPLSIIMRKEKFTKGC